MQQRMMASGLFLALLMAAGGTASVGESGEQLAMIWPKRLEPGDTIAFVAPAGPPERDQVMLAKQRIEERGYRGWIGLEPVEDRAASAELAGAAEFLRAL